MESLTIIKPFAPLLVFLVSFILIYIGMKKIEVPGDDYVLAILSFLISLALVAYETTINFVMGFLPVMAVLIVVAFIFILTLSFATKDFELFQKPLAWIIFITGIIIIVLLAFNSFPHFSHMLPGTSNSGLSSSLRTIKSTIYSDTIIQNFLFIAIALGTAIFVVKAK